MDSHAKMDLQMQLADVKSYLKKANISLEYNDQKEMEEALLDLYLTAREL
jgi:hypothetical protein